MKPIEEDKVTVAVTEERGISHKNAGVYGESIIINGTSEDIIAVTASGGRYTIEPDYSHRDGNITVIIRTTNGARSDAQGGEATIPTTRYTIPADLIQRGYYLHKASGTVLANSEVGKTITHPKADKYYSEMMSDLLQRVAGTGCTSIRFTVNDPLRKTEKVYGCIGEHCFVIPCTNIKDSSNIAKCVTYLHDGTKAFSQSSQEIEDLFQVGSIEVEAFNNIMALGLTADDAITKFSNICTSKESELNKTISERVVDHRKRSIEETDRERDKLNAEISKTNIKLTQKTTELDSSKLKTKTLQDELDAKDKLIQNWKAQQEYSAEERVREDKEYLAQDKLYEQRHKTRRAEIASNSETHKIWINIGGIVVTALISGLITLIASKGKD